MAKVLAISSHVARGGVGLAATVPALQWLGHEVWALPTVLLATRPGLGTLARHAVPAGDLAAMLAALETDGCWRSVDAVLTGYFPSPASVSAAAAAVRQIRQAAPHVPVLVDPIVGDAGRLYVAEEIAAAIRDELVPLASIATPNLFELGWLTGAPEGAPGGTPVGTAEGAAPASAADVVEAARRLGPATVVVTSAVETEASIATLAVAAHGAVEGRLPRRAGIPNGAGDLLAGLYLGHLLRGLDVVSALDASLADLDRVLVASVGADVLNLAALRSDTGEPRDARGEPVGGSLAT